MNFIIPLNLTWRRFIQLQVKVTICKHIIQIIKKIAKLNIHLVIVQLNLESVAAPGLRIWGGGAFEGQTHILRGQDRFLPMPLSQDFCPPPPGDSPPLSKGGDIPRNTAPGGRPGECPRNIASPL